MIYTALATTTYKSCCRIQCPEGSLRQRRCSGTLWRWQHSTSSTSLYFWRHWINNIQGLRYTVFITTFTFTTFVMACLTVIKKWVHILLIPLLTAQFAGVRTNIKQRVLWPTENDFFLELQYHNVEQIDWKSINSWWRKTKKYCNPSSTTPYCKEMCLQR